MGIIDYIKINIYKCMNLMIYGLIEKLICYQTGGKGPSTNPKSLPFCSPNIKGRTQPPLISITYGSLS